MDNDHPPSPQEVFGRFSRLFERCAAWSPRDQIRFLDNLSHACGALAGLQASSGTAPVSAGSSLHARVILDHLRIVREACARNGDDALAVSLPRILGIDVRDGRLAFVTDGRRAPITKDEWMMIAREALRRRHLVSGSAD